MGKAAVFITLLCVVVGGSLGASSDNNKTIECVFSAFNSCYNPIQGLGSNFSAHYDQTDREINATCRSENKVRDCVQRIPTQCDSRTPLSGPMVQSINNLVHSLCTNSSWQQNNFKNSSECYNKNQQRRLNCARTYSAGSKTDAKSLCCASAQQVRCLKKDMKGACARNATDFYSSLVDTYTQYQSALCESYVKQYCATAANHIASATAILSLSFTSIMIPRVMK